jgi:diacylglycerol kinase family enzyme
VNEGSRHTSQAAQSRFRIRLAAVVALLALACSVAVALAALIDGPDDFVGLLLWIFLFAFSAWFVLTRRRLLVRLIAVPFLLLGLAGIVATIGVYIVPFLALIALLAVFGFAGRYAVAQDRKRVYGALRGKRVGPSRRAVLLINPKSGGGKAERFNLPEEARKRGVEPVLLEPGSDLRELAEGAVADGADVIGMAGGDGSQALVAGVAMRRGVAHVCIPAGTRNHFALDLGLDRDDVVGALDAFTDGVERRIDLGCVNDLIFVNNASLGLYARVVQSADYRGAKLTTWRRMLPELLGPGKAVGDLHFVGPDQKAWDDPALVMVSNNPYRLRGGGAGTRTRLDTGQLGIVVTQLGRATDLAKLVTLSSLGLSQRFRGLRGWSATEFEVSSGSCVAAGIDGEALSLAPPLRFQALPGALRVRVPRQARGLSPAAAAVSVNRGDFTALLRIAAGKPGCRGPDHVEAPSDE